MKEILFLNLKIAIGFAIFYLVYLLFFSKDTFFVRNRFYLLFATIIAVSVPFLKIPLYVNAPAFTDLPLLVENPPVFVHETADFSNQLTFQAIVIKGLFLLYLTGLIFMLLRLFWGIRKIVSLIRNANRKMHDNMVVASIKQPISPFSIYRWLIIPEEYFQHQDITKIVQHELVHCRQYHSIDLLVAEIVLAFQWFNPFAWMVKKAMTQNHEFIVDQKLLANGLETKAYQYSLLHTINQEQKLPIVNHFNANLLKKRIIMMNKSESPKWYGLKNVVILISFVLVVSLTATFETKVLAQDANSQKSATVDDQKNNGQGTNANNRKKVKTLSVIKDTLVNDKSQKHLKQKEIVLIVKDSVSDLNENEDMIERSDIDNDSVNHSKGKVVKRIFLQAKGNSKAPLIIIDGKRVDKEELDKMDPSEIERVDVWKEDAAMQKYGEDAKNGVVEVKSKIFKISYGIKTGLTISETSDNLDVSILDENNIKPNAPYEVRVSDNEGNTVFNLRTKDKTFQIPLAKLTKSNYFISVVNVENHYSCSNNYTLKHK